MRLESVCCNHCGAPLEVPADARFVTCRHCGSSLAIRRSESAVTTEVLQQMSEQMQEMSAEISRLRCQNELSELDRQWDRDKERYMIRQKDGSLREPSLAVATFIGVVGVLGGGAFAIIGLANFSPIALFGLLFIGVGIVAALVQSAKARDYRHARERYAQRRAAILQRLDAGPGGGDGPRALPSIEP
ncbi:MAG: hypothetical protein HYS13_15165 [Planctomycetia bacterium]|nr:hypothetical protein [Planctomycetia bacterium]